MVYSYFYLSALEQPLRADAQPFVFEGECWNYIPYIVSLLTKHNISFYLSLLSDY